MRVFLKTLASLLLLLGYQHCHAYIFGISGQVQNFGQPSAYNTVEVFTDDYSIYNYGFTDQAGNYGILLEIPDGTAPVINVVTYDYCTWNQNGQQVNAFAGTATVNLSICDPNSTCQASYYLQQIQSDPLTVQFTDNSLILNGNYLWDFGDGNTSTEQNPVHTYATPGYKFVNLTVSNDQCSSTTGYWQLVADPDRCGCPSYFAPYCYTLPDGTPVSFSNECEAICFGYPDATPCFDENFCYTYFASAPDSLKPNLISFHALVFGEPISYFWDFGDGTTSTEANPTHLYPEGDGGYFVQLTIETTSGCTASNNSSVYVGAGCDCPSVYAPVCFTDALGSQIVLTNNCYAECIGITDYENCNGGTYCYADFGVTLLDSASFTYQFTDNSYGNVLSYEWTFGDGSTSSEQSPSHSYQNEGSYLVGLTIITSDSCTAYQVYHLMVGDGQFDCYAFFSYEINTLNPLSLSFTDFSSLFTTSPVVSWSWNFGDGSTSNEQNPVHDFDDYGYYNISLSITTEDGCTSTNSYTIMVEENPGLPSCYAYYWIEQSPNDSSSVQFMDMSSDSVDEWFWSFGDGGTSTEQNPTHTYGEPGVYLTSLTVTSSTDGCTNTYTLLVLIGNDVYYGGNCQALFIPQVSGLDVQFFDFSSPLPAAEYYWEFGDGNTSTQSNPIHTYEQMGIYTAMLTITTADGCTSSFSVTMDLMQGSFWGNSAPSALILNSTKEESLYLGDLRLFPNPASDVANLGFINKLENGPLHLSLHNATGQQVWAANVQPISGAQQVQVPTASLPAGLYLLRLSGDSGQQTLKLVKE